MLALTSSTPAQESAQHLGNHHTDATEGRRRLSPIGYEPVASSELTQASRLPHWQPVMSDSPSGLIHDHRKRILTRLKFVVVPGVLGSVSAQLLRRKEARLAKKSGEQPNEPRGSVSPVAAA